MIPSPTSARRPVGGHSSRRAGLEPTPGPSFRPGRGRAVSWLDVLGVWILVASAGTVGIRGFCELALQAKPAVNALISGLGAQ